MASSPELESFTHGISCRSLSEHRDGLRASVPDGRCLEAERLAFIKAQADGDVEEGVSGQRRVQALLRTGKVVKLLPLLPIVEYYAFRFAVAVQSQEYGAATRISAECIKAVQEITNRRQLRKVPLSRLLHPSRQLSDAEQEERYALIDHCEQLGIETYEDLSTMTQLRMAQVGLSEREIVLLVQMLVRVQSILDAKRRGEYE